MSESDSSKLHIVMFPWVAYGHFIPFIHLSNKLAQKGHQISFLLPKGVQPKLENMNQCPSLIQFFPLTRDQVEDILKVLRPDVVLYDFWFWIPDLARQLGICPVLYTVVSSMSMGLNTKELTKEMIVDEVMELPPGYPSSTVRLRAEEAAAMLFEAEDDVIAFRTCREIEGPFLDFVGQGFGKLILLSGPCLSETKTEQLDNKWVNWLSKFEPGSVVFCSYGSQKPEYVAEI
ncbi:hypothetical protein V6N11_038536 [Hibiscus sabdariffa]|uniref:Uncharacterized protein n=1 Tax=Hibiscus sabdariffa TaxID=183260 RepID=A0ABR2SKB3_9ROSI